MDHGGIPVLGFRIDDFAYCTDTNFIPEASFELLKGVKVLVLDALQYKKHPTHFTIDEAIAVSRRIGAEQTYFTHIAQACRMRRAAHNCHREFIWRMTDYD